MTRTQKTVSRRIEDIAWAMALTCLVLGALGGIALAGVLGIGGDGR